MIDVCDVVKSFDGFRALNGISLSVPQVHLRVGRPNGSGNPP
jgi:ABC-type uncharacterized transport system ATPase subunit